MLSDMFVLARTPDLELREYRSVLERDPLIAARLIRTAQSAGYGTVVRPVATLDEAFARLGVLQLRRFCSDGAAQLHVLDEPLYALAYEQISRHGVATAHVARMLGARLGIDGELAFLSGLLHDVGLAAAFVEVAQGEAKFPSTNVEAAWEIAREASSQAAIALARAWSLSSEVAAVTLGHHDPPPHVDRLTAVVAFANWAASEAGFGLPDEGDAPNPSVRDVLSLGDEDVVRLADEAAKMLVHVDVE
jgi:HD-like signal output (HDOD) protein